MCQIMSDHTNNASDDYRDQAIWKPLVENLCSWCESTSSVIRGDKGVEKNGGSTTSRRKTEIDFRRILTPTLCCELCTYMPHVIINKENKMLWHPYERICIKNENVPINNAMAGHETIQMRIVECTDMPCAK